MSRRSSAHQPPLVPTSFRSQLSASHVGPLRSAGPSFASAKFVTKFWRTSRVSVPCRSHQFVAHWLDCAWAHFLLASISQLFFFFFVSRHRSSCAGQLGKSRTSERRATQARSSGRSLPQRHSPERQKEQCTAQRAALPNSNSNFALTFQLFALVPSFLNHPVSLSVDPCAFEMSPCIRILFSPSLKSLLKAPIIASGRSVTLNPTCCVCIKVAASQVERLVSALLWSSRPHSSSGSRQGQCQPQA